MDQNVRPKYPHVINMVTMTCNLHCKLCIICVPYYEKPWHPTLEYVNEVTDRLFAIGDYEIFEFHGGEPLLRKDLHEIWAHGLRYIDHADMFKTVTNGSVLPSDELIDVWKRYGEKFHCIVDDYGPELSVHVDEVVRRLREAGISCDRRDYTVNRHQGGWIDFRADRPKFTEEEAVALYSRCGEAQKLRHCCNTIRGIVMPCHFQFQLNDRGICSPKPYEFIDLFDDGEPMEVKRGKMAGFRSLRSLSACAYCPGMDETVERFTPAVQLAAEEEKFTTIRVKEC